MHKAACGIFDSCHCIEVFDIINWPNASIPSGSRRFTLPAEHDSRNIYPEYGEYCSDLHLYAWVKSNSNLARDILNTIDLSGSTSVTVWIEYPWLIHLAANIKQILSTEYNLNPKQIYSSANIEHVVYKEIIEARNREDLSGLPPLVQKVEKLAISSSDFLLVCSQADKDAIYYSHNRDSLLVPNGVSRTQYSLSKVAASPLFAVLSNTKYLFYAASDWPPNTDNIQEYLGKSLGFIPPDCRLIVAGGASRVFSELYIGEASCFTSLNQSRLHVLGNLNVDDFSAAHTLAYGYFLPVGYGGGTCLKTAEAIYSNKCLVASPAALRGYSKYEAKLKNIIRAQDCEQFRSAIQSIFNKQYKPLIPTEGKLRLLEELTWETIILNLVNRLAREF
jgi:hypothetical protein